MLYWPQFRGISFECKDVTDHRQWGFSKFQYPRGRTSSSAEKSGWICARRGSFVLLKRSRDERKGKEGEESVTVTSSGKRRIVFWRKVATDEFEQRFLRGPKSSVSSSSIYRHGSEGNPFWETRWMNARWCLTNGCNVRCWVARRECWFYGWSCGKWKFLSFELDAQVAWTNFRFTRSLRYCLKQMSFVWISTRSLSREFRRFYRGRIWLQDRNVATP